MLRTTPSWVWVDRLVVGLDALATYVDVTPGLPRDTTMGAVLGWSPLSPDEPVLFVYTACASSGAHDAAIGHARDATSAVAAGARSAPLYRRESSGRYLGDLPEFAIPGQHGAEPEPTRLPQPGTVRAARSSARRCSPAPRSTAPSRTRSRTGSGAAPTPACPIDFQRTGGALADVDDTDTAFWGSSGEWNIPSTPSGARPTWWSA